MTMKASSPFQILNSHNNYLTMPNPKRQKAIVEIGAWLIVAGLLFLLTRAIFF